MCVSVCLFLQICLCFPCAQWLLLMLYLPFSSLLFSSLLQWTKSVDSFHFLFCQGRFHGSPGLPIFFVFFFSFFVVRIASSKLCQDVLSKEISPGQSDENEEEIQRAADEQHRNYHHMPPKDRKKAFYKELFEITQHIEDEFRHDLAVHLYSAFLTKQKHFLFPPERWALWPLSILDVPDPNPGAKYVDELKIKRKQHDWKSSINGGPSTPSGAHRNPDSSNGQVQDSSEEIENLSSPIDGMKFELDAIFQRKVYAKIRQHAQQTGKPLLPVVDPPVRLHQHHKNQIIDKLDLLLTKMIETRVGRKDLRTFIKRKQTSQQQTQQQQERDQNQKQMELLKRPRKGSWLDILSLHPNKKVFVQCHKLFAAYSKDYVEDNSQEMHEVEHAKSGKAQMKDKGEESSDDNSDASLDIVEDDSVADILNVEPNYKKRTHKMKYRIKLNRDKRLDNIKINHLQQQWALQEEEKQNRYVLGDSDIEDNYLLPEKKKRRIRRTVDGLNK